MEFSKIYSVSACRTVVDEVHGRVVLLDFEEQGLLLRHPLFPVRVKPLIAISWGHMKRYLRNILEKHC